MNALLSIKPEFAGKILANEKRYEFRRTTFSDAAAIDFVYLYASTPVKQIVGGFTIQRVIEASPDELWNLFGSQSGIDNRDRFMSYFDGVDTGYAIEIDRIYGFQDPINPSTIFEEFVPPVSFHYLDGHMNSTLRQHLPATVQRTQTTQLPQFSSD